MAGISFTLNGRSVLGSSGPMTYDFIAELAGFLPSTFPSMTYRAARKGRAFSTEGWGEGILTPGEFLNVGFKTVVNVANTGSA